MGRPSRHSAKTGDQALYKSRPEDEPTRDDSDDDPMYNEVERYHNRKEEEAYLKLDGNSDDEGESSEDDGITKNQEGVFDLGMGGSSEDDDDENGSEDKHERTAQHNKKQRAAEIEAALASTDDDGKSDSGDDEDGKP